MSNRYLLDRIAGRDPNLRAADADRDRFAERLRVSHSEGRLDLEEFQQRLERCLHAKTVGELSELVRDLPSGDEPDRRRSAGRAWAWRWPVVPVVPILIAIVVLSTAVVHHVFWLWIPLLFVLWRMSWSRRGWPAGARRGPHSWI